MRTNRILNLTSLLAAAAALSFGLTACGSDDDDPGTGTTATETTKTTSTETNSTGATGTSDAFPEQDEKKSAGKKDPGAQSGGITPGKPAPDSAGDKSGNAPDDVISKRPGGPDN